MDTQLSLGILIGYLLLLLGIGLYASRKIKTPNGFFLADRSVGRFALTATITATVVGGSATIATGALIYSSGLPGIWIDIGGGIGLIILGFTIAKMVRKTGLITLPEITGRLFDAKVRYVAAILIIITEIAWLSLLIQASGAVLSVLLPIEYELLLISVTLIFISYTFLGGQFAVVYTDIIQFIVMIIGVCILAAPLLYMDAAPLFSQLTTEQLSFPINTTLGVLPVLSFFFMMLMPHIVGPDIYSKILSSKDERAAKYGVVLSGVFKLLFAVAIAVIALSAAVLYPNLENASLAIPTVVLHLSPILAGVVLAAFISVMLSSADSVLLSAGTILSVDLVKKQSIILSRVGIIIIGLFALLLSLYLNNIISSLTLAYTVFTAGLTLPIIFGFYKDKTRVTSTGALLSLILGGSISLVWLYLENPFAINAVLVGLVVSFVPLVVFRKKS